MRIVERARNAWNRNVRVETETVADVLQRFSVDLRITHRRVVLGRLMLANTDEPGVTVSHITRDHEDFLRAASDYSAVRMNGLEQRKRLHMGSLQMPLPSYYLPNPIASQFPEGKRMILNGALTFKIGVSPA